MMGPYSRVDITPRGSDGELPGPYWARDASRVGESRGFELPCYGASLKGDMEPPFTCGSDTRRAIIKHFVRVHVNQNGKRNGNNLVEELVQQMIERLKTAWSDISKFACECTDGSGLHKLSCCKWDPQGGKNCDEMGECGENFISSTLQEEFSQISGEEVTKKITSLIPDYLRKIMTDNGADAFKLFNKGDTASWDWGESGVAEAARQDHLYGTYEPVMNYSAGETGFPFKARKSMWHMCTGLISQVNP